MRRKLLAFMGFFLGMFGILATFPPSFLNNPLADEVELTQTDEPNPLPAQSEPAESIASPLPSSSPLPTVKPTATVTVKPTATVTAKPTTSTTLTSKVITGGSYPADKYGDVQIQITVVNGAVTAVKVLKTPDADSRSLAVSQMAVPILTFQTIEARDSSAIQGASGASYTSDAWIKSLQSALSQL
jgi:uncharacterized protein with FMN-binding domain